MTSWNTNINEAPEGRVEIQTVTRKDGKTATSEVFHPAKVLVSTKCKKVMFSYILQSGRWHGLATDEKPEAWQPVPEAAQ